MLKIYHIKYKSAYSENEDLFYCTRDDGSVYYTRLLEEADSFFSARVANEIIKQEQQINNQVFVVVAKQLILKRNPLRLI